jgi:hypothetical protein
LFWANKPSAIPTGFDADYAQGEARQLALMADRIDSENDHTPVHGLSIWVGLASFFTSSPDHSKTLEALKQAKQVRKANKKESKPNAVKKMGAMLGFGRKGSVSSTSTSEESGTE